MLRERHHSRESHAGLPPSWAAVARGSVGKARQRGAVLRRLTRVLAPVTLLLAVAVLLAAVVLALGGLGVLVSKVVPLTTFQAAALMLGAAAAAFALLLLQDIRDLVRDALFEEEEWDEDAPSETPHLHPVLPFPKEDIVADSGECPCGSGRPYEACCGRGVR